MIVFDTSAVIDFLHGGANTKKVVEDLEKRGEEVGVSTVSLFELLAPIYHRRLVNEEKNVRSFIGRSLVLPLDEGSAEEASRTMGLLMRIGRPVNAFDALIAGIALEHRAEALVTKDTNFEEIAKVVDLELLKI